MSEKISFDISAYRDLCHAINVPVFYQPWWLDVVAEQRWQVILYREDPDYIALSTYFLKRKGPFSYITMPALTKFAGPYFLRQLSTRKQRRIITAFEKALPSVSGFQQTFHYNIDYWLPYFWQGYQQTVHYSFLLKGLQDLEGTYTKMAADYRNNKIGKAKDQVEILYDLDRDILLRLMEAPFRRQGISLPVSKEIMHRIIEACEERNAGRSLYAQDAEGRIHAAIFLIWDEECTYLLLAGEDQTLRSSGAGIYLTWKGMEYASQVVGSSAFDFLGGMSENLERTRQQFGAEPVPYFYISRWRGLPAIARALQRWLS